MAQQAFDAREEKLSLLNGAIIDVNTLLKFKAGKDAVDTALLQMNECFEEYKKTHADYLTLISGQSDEDKVKSQYEDTEKKVHKVREEAGIYCYRLDQAMSAVATENSKEGNGEKDRSTTENDRGLSEGDKKAEGRVTDGDSIGQVSSKSKAAARMAALEAKKKQMELKHQLEIEEQNVKFRKERLAIDMELTETAAEEGIIREAIDITSKDSDIEFAPFSKGDKQSDFFDQQRQLIHLLQAPKLDIPTFNGDPLKYFVFIRAFTANVEEKIKDNGARLTQLIQHCTGPALTVVQGCAIMDPEEGYPSAKQLIKDRFGNPLIIAQAWIDHVTDRDQIKNDDGTGIQEYSDLLRTCLHTLKAMDALAEVSAQSTLLQIVAKLPSKSADRWRRHAVYVRRTHARLPVFEDVVSFAETLAEESNVPLFSHPKVQPTQRNEKRNKPAKSASYSTGAGNSSYSKKCALCESPHMLWECPKFKMMSPDERYKVVKSKHLCFNCLAGSNHGSRDCRSKRRCGVDSCGRKHSYLLHGANPDNHPHKDENNLKGQREQIGSKDSHLDVKDTNGTGFSAFVGSSCFMGSQDDKIALPIVAVRVYSPLGHKTIETYALLDNGSSHSFCDQSLIDELGIKGEKSNLTLTTLEKRESPSTCQVVKLDISDLAGNNQVKLPVVYGRACLPISADNLASQGDVSGFPHLSGVNIPVATSKQVRLLIGQDNPDLLIPMNVIKGAPGQPWACQTLLGWVLNGPLSKNQGKKKNRATSCFVKVNNDQLFQSVEKFWKIDSSGLYDEKARPSVNDKKVMDLWEETTVQVDGNYIMKIPFKEENARLPNNRSMAMHRLASLEKKLEKNCDLKGKYVTAVEELLEKGHAIQVPERDEKRSDGLVWYLPHHAVINENKPKIRIVFDGAAKYAGCSLNSRVHQGPDLISKLLGVLLRSRLRPVCIMADVSAMFMQVKVVEDHQDVLRFLWRPGGNMKNDVKEYRLTRHIFGGCWSAAAACHALQKTADDYGHNYNEYTSTVLKRDMYMDDLVSSTNTVMEAKNLQVELKQLLGRGGFNLTKWSSNKPEVLADLTDTERSKNMMLDYESEMIERALGLQWNLKEDTIGYKTKMNDKACTKRGALSMLSSIFDPIGLANPLILRARKIVQELFRLKIDWDEPMPLLQKEQWEEWVKDLPNLAKFKVPRCVTPQGTDGIIDRQLHHFADASTLAYGVCSYLRQVDKGGNVSVNLIMAKSRLAPLREITVPRLELAGATLAVRQNSLLEEELDIKIDKTFYWSDSMIVLKYLSNEDKRFHTYVANRVAVIRSLSSPQQWRHVPTSENPADIASRGSSAKDLNNQMWVNGPAFLSQPDTDWPPFEDTHLDPNDPEVKANKTKTQAFLAQGQSTATDKLIEAFSCWQKLRKAVGWMLVLRGILRGKSGPVPDLDGKKMKEAQFAIIQYLQRKEFKDDIMDLETNGTVGKSSKLFKLKPMLKEGLVVVGGRLANAPINESAKYPIILPGDHPAVQLMIRNTHESSGHSGRETVLSLLMRHYWIIGARSGIRKILSKCIPCKRREAPPCKQLMANLPRERVTPGGRAFLNTGVDYYGPVLIKKGRRREKRWGCIFCCLVTRGVHVEISYSLSADSFLQCLERFIARRGKPQSLRSDRGRNFIKADKDLRAELESWNKKQVQDYLNKKDIEWTFQPPYASHHGGCTERMIRSMRRVLHGLSNEQVLTDEGLHTLTCMAESVLNSRPLTSNSVDPKDLTALTPSHFLNLEPVDPIPGVSSHSDLLRKTWRQIRYLADVFWRRWQREYLPNLQERTKWAVETRNIKVGDLVVIVDYSLPRNEWALGRIIKVNVSGDDRVRSVWVKTSAKEVERPISKVCLLEASDQELPPTKFNTIPNPTEE